MQRVQETNLASHPPDDGAEPPYDYLPGPGGVEKLMSDHVSESDLKPARPRLDAHDQARDLIRLVQCEICSKPFRAPVTLPCGHTVCKACLPEPTPRLHISYPNTPERQLGLTCPAEGCEQEYPVTDCNVDVVLAEVMDVIRSEVVRSEQEAGQSTIYIRARDMDSEKQSPPAPLDGTNARQLKGGRLLATYLLADMGELDYRSGCDYDIDSAESAGVHSDLDYQLLEGISNRMQSDLDCQVCYGTFLHPVTTPCGHTFCRKCLVRALDHANYCPMCRCSLSVAPSLIGTANNYRLEALLANLCPEVMEARTAALAEEESRVGELDTAIFVCTMAFPHMPTFLHIFEPRYRLMIRRALESNRRFGMVNYSTPQYLNGLGRVSFTQYGTMLEITNYSLLPDGRSVIETMGVYPFKVKKVGNLDGYMIGEVERIHDISTIEEEDRERQELLANPRPDPPAPATDVPASDAPQDPPFSLRHDSPLTENPSQPAIPATPPPPPLESLTTEELFQLGRDFIARMHAVSAPWLQARIIAAYGDLPDEPKLFPYWFASVLPIAEAEKYTLLHTTSVRERLKIVVGWIRHIDGQRLTNGGVCSIL